MWKISFQIFSKWNFKYMNSYSSVVKLIVTNRSTEFVWRLNKKKISKHSEKMKVYKESKKFRFVNFQDCLRLKLTENKLQKLFTFDNCALEFREQLSSTKHLAVSRVSESFRKMKFFHCFPKRVRKNSVKVRLQKSTCNQHVQQSRSPLPTDNILIAQVVLERS